MIRLGIIGTGSMAANHAESFSRMRGVKLAACDQFLLDQTFAPGHVAGARYNDAGLALLDR